MYRLRDGVYPRSLVRIQSGEARLDGLENLFLWVQLRQGSCTWSKQKRVTRLDCGVERNSEQCLTFVVGSLKVNFVADLGVFWWLDEFDATILALFRGGLNKH